MHRFRETLVIVVACLALATSAASGQTLGAVLSGTQEVPANANPGFGNATVTFDATHQNIHVTITVANLGSPINNFHIHEAPPGANGPVVVDLINLGGTFVNGTMTGTFPVSAAVAARMLQNPRNFYVNVHTVAIPTGAVRGNLSYVNGGAITYAAELRPGNEVPPTNSSAFGSAFVTFDPVNSTMAFETRASGIANATMAHIHRGAAGVNGPVIINFATNEAQIAGGRASGSGPITALQSGNLQQSDLTALANATTAAGYYVNVHSSAFPGGEIRGQLVPANEYDIAIAGRVTNGRGQTFVTDVRVFNPSYTAPATALIEYFEAGLSANATAKTSIVVNVAPRATSLLDDIATTLDVVGTTGALRVTSASALAVTSRIYSDRADDDGTLGQFVPALPPSAALRRGVTPHLANNGFRTNLGLFNPNQTDVTVRLELRNVSGALVAQETMTLAGWSQQQRSLGTYFEGVDLATVENATLSFDASSPIFLYASVIDNVSGDSMLVPAQTDAGLAASQ
ncbi:MAG TPA: CHRD domain-containing protein [Thermoanaerobaculia bacterium]|nr:CHRD domain-containing protein [Thermoanaerobaculia bacterium]